MNGHHADCSCQSCTIGREIGFDRALDLLADVRTAFALLPRGCRSAFSQNLFRKVRDFLSEHAEHE